MVFDHGPWVRIVSPGDSRGPRNLRSDVAQTVLFNRSYYTNLQQALGVIRSLVILGRIVWRSVSLERACEAEPAHLNLLGVFLRRVLVA